MLTMMMATTTNTVVFSICMRVFNVFKICAHTIINVSGRTRLPDIFLDRRQFCRFWCMNTDMKRCRKTWGRPLDLSYSSVELAKTKYIDTHVYMKCMACAILTVCKLSKYNFVMPHGQNRLQSISKIVMKSMQLYPPRFVAFKIFIPFSTQYSVWLVQLFYIFETIALYIHVLYLYVEQQSSVTLEHLLVSSFFRYMTNSKQWQSL